MFDCDHDGKRQPVVTKKNKMDYGDESKLFAHLDTSEFCGKDHNDLLSNRVYVQIFRLLIETLQKENDPIVIEETENEYRQKSMRKTFVPWECPSFEAKKSTH